jgi:hypothetical protein
MPDGAENRRSVAVPGHSNSQMTAHFSQFDRGPLYHIAAPGDGRTPAAMATLDFGLRALDFTLFM